MIRSIINYLVMLISGYVILLGFFCSLGIELESFPQALVDNKIIQIFWAYIALFEALKGDRVTVILIILFYYLSSLFLSKNNDKYNSIFGSTLGPLVKEGMEELGIEDYSYDLNSSVFENAMDSLPEVSNVADSLKDNASKLKNKVNVNKVKNKVENSVKDNTK